MSQITQRKIPPRQSFTHTQSEILENSNLMFVSADSLETTGRLTGAEFAEFVLRSASDFSTCDVSTETLAETMWKKKGKKLIPTNVKGNIFHINLILVLLVDILKNILNIKNLLVIKLKNNH